MTLFALRTVGAALHLTHVASDFQHNIFSTSDGVRLFERKWEPAIPPAAIVVIVHGFAEHGGCYTVHASRMVAAGLSVEAIDLRGHGKSDGPRGYVASAARLVQDVTEQIGRLVLRPATVGIPVFLMGHSFGATIAGLAALRVPTSVTGLILCSPALRIGEPEWVQRLAVATSRFAPWLPGKRLNRSLLSTDDDVVRNARQDPLNFHGFIRVGSAAQMVMAGRELMNHGAELDLPLLIIHGTEDRLTLPFASAHLFQRARSTNKALSLFHGMRHETLNEPEGRQVMDRIIDFIEEQCVARTSTA